MDSDSSDSGGRPIAVEEPAGELYTALPHGEITRQIIGASIEVLNSLKPGLEEKIYENALIHELTLRGVETENQKVFPVRYKDHPVGRLIPDLIVEGQVIVDTKVVTAFNETHLAQMLGYLAITGLKVGLLVNFHHSTLQWKRVQR
ncbi:MAG: GxxExxY protein [Opitutales bacterium]|nr:GxxExxY protein [Opitutales bacterium]